MKEEKKLNCKRRNNLFGLMEEEFIFYNKRQNNFEKISKQETNLIMKLIAEEKIEVDKTISNAGDITIEYFPDLAYYWDNKPYLIKLIINKIKDDIESSKKYKKIKANKEEDYKLNHTRTNNSLYSSTNTFSTLSSNKKINQQVNIHGEDNNILIGNSINNK